MDVSQELGEVCVEPPHCAASCKRHIRNDRYWCRHGEEDTDLSTLHCDTGWWADEWVCNVEVHHSAVPPSMRHDDKIMIIIVCIMSKLQFKCDTDRFTHVSQGCFYQVFSPSRILLKRKRKRSDSVLWQKSHYVYRPLHSSPGQGIIIYMVSCYSPLCHHTLSKQCWVHVTQTWLDPGGGIGI